jgi:biopolymer transport protein ExbD
MRVRNIQRRAGEDVELQMTPMIDIVFQLLIFFIMTFKIMAPEGDFNIKMPLAGPSEGPPPIDQLPPIIVRMTAQHAGPAQGHLAVLKMNERVLFSVPTKVVPAEDASPQELEEFDRFLDSRFAVLRGEVMTYLGVDEGAGPVADTTEVELDCDPDLQYDYVIRATTAVSGYVDPQTREIHKLLEKITLSPPKQAPLEP